MTEHRLGVGVPRLSVADLVEMSRMIYRDTPLGVRYKQMLRPYICPFHVILELVPQNASLLDVGCGAGLFIALLAQLGRVGSALGFDADEAAIQVAGHVAAKLPSSDRLRFERRDASASWPAGRFDVVSLIDVIHHVPPRRQADVIAAAAEHVAAGGLLLYKDMSHRPRWRAWANRLHDLLSARQWIHYATVEKVVAWAGASFQVVERGEMNMLWYRHEWCVFRRIAPPGST